MAVTDIQVTLAKSIRNIAEHHKGTLGPISDRFIAEAVMKARELETERDDNKIAGEVRKLVLTSYPSLTDNPRGVIIQELVSVMISNRERLKRH